MLRIIRYFFFIALLTSIPVSSWAKTYVFDQVNIDVINQIHNSNETKRLIPFQPKEKISEKEIQEKIEELEALDFIKSISYKITGRKNKSLNIEVVEHRFVRSVIVKYNYPFLDKEIRRTLPFQRGSPFDQKMIPEAIVSVQGFLKKRGYYDSKVEIQTKLHKKYNTIDVTVKLNKGKKYRLGDVDVEGNENISDSRIKTMLSHWTRFQETELKRDLKKIKRKYTKKGFIKARVKVTDIDLDNEKKKANLTLKVRENKRAHIKFKGKLKVPVEKLREILDLKNRRSYDRFAVKLGEKRLLKYYKSQGYNEAYISHKIQKTDDIVNITYTIQAGKRFSLNNIKFVGNRKVSSGKLKKKISSRESGVFDISRFQEVKLYHDVAFLKDYYRSLGFFDVRVSDPKITSSSFGDQKEVKYEITEGVRYKISKISFLEDSDQIDNKLLRKSRLIIGKPWTKNKITEAKAKITRQFHSNGYAYTDLNIGSEVNRDSKTVELKVSLKKGPLTRIRKLIVKGIQKTRRKVIVKDLKLKEGKPFVFETMLNDQLNLRRLAIFDSVRMKPLGFEDKSESIDLLILVQERKTITVNIQAGIDNRNLVRGEFNFTKRNLFGLAKQFNARLIGGTRFNRGEFTFFSPRINGVTVNLSNQYFFQYEDAPNFNAYSYGGFISVLKNFGSKISLGLKNQITRTEVIESQSNVARLGNSLFDNTFNEVEGFFIYDTRNNFSDPTRGFYLLVKNEFNLDLSDTSNMFNTFEFNISHHLGFFKRISIHNTIRYGHTFRLAAQPRIPANKLFFLGGSDTIRGFAEDAVNPSGGTVQLIYNGELHIGITEALKLAAFFDIGFLQNDINSLSVDDFREAAGVGLRYITPVGPLRLDYGRIIDRRVGEPKQRFHFSFGYFF